MTSIPASRKARAIIFAPRSCPSSPGFATTTRIFLSSEDAMRRGSRGTLAAARARIVVVASWRAAPLGLLDDDLLCHQRGVQRAVQEVGALPLEHEAEGAAALV